MSRHARRARLALAAAPAPQPARATDHTSTLLARIGAGKLDAELTTLHDAIAQRLETMRAMQTASALLAFQSGDRVRLNTAARPNYLHGVTGTVTGLIDQQVIVTLDQPIGRLHSGQLRCPPLLLDKLGVEGPE